MSKTDIYHFYNIEYVYNTYSNGFVAWIFWLVTSAFYLITVSSIKWTLKWKREREENSEKLLWNMTRVCFYFSAHPLFLGGGTHGNQQFVWNEHLTVAIYFFILYHKCPGLMFVITNSKLCIAAASDTWGDRQGLWKW